MTDTYNKWREKHISNDDRFLHDTTKTISLCRKDSRYKKIMKNVLDKVWTLQGHKEPYLLNIIIISTTEILV